MPCAANFDPSDLIALRFAGVALIFTLVSDVFRVYEDSTGLVPVKIFVHHSPAARILRTFIFRVALLWWLIEVITGCSLIAYVLRNSTGGGQFFRAQLLVNALFLPIMATMIVLALAVRMETPRFLFDRAT